MTELTLSLAIIALIVFYVGMGVWLFSGLLLVGSTAVLLLLGFPLDRLGAIMQAIVWKSSSSWELAAIPMFLWMGEIILRTDISERMFKGLEPWVDRIPGRLLHANVTGCTIFAAVTGSGLATTAMVGKVNLPAMKERNYDISLSLGSLAGAGGFGILIPPSIVMIIYGVLAEVSIPRLFAAGFLPGLMIAGLYSIYICTRCVINPDLAPKSDRTYVSSDYVASLFHLFPIFVIIVLVLGSIYSGIATPSEAATVGVSSTLLVLVLYRQFRLSKIIDAAFAALETSCMICTIIAAAAFLSTILGFLHVPANIAAGIDLLELPPFGLLILLALFYIFLGMFLDGISIVVMTLPIALPMVVGAGFDPIWFGVFLVIMVELGGITPPVGLTLFVIQGITKESLYRVTTAAMPFFALMCLGLGILVIWPQIVLWLPQQLFG